MKINSKLIKALYHLSFAIATVAVNTTCHKRFYQEKLNPQLEQLKKYHDR